MNQSRTSQNTPRNTPGNTPGNRIRVPGNPPNTPNTPNAPASSAAAARSAPADSGATLPLDFDASPPDRALFDTIAESYAHRFHATRITKANKSTQIRRFYDEVVSWQERIGDDDDKFRQYEAFLRMLNAKVAYAKGRELVDDAFANWFRQCLSQTSSARALSHFRLHFEAMLGFLKALRP